MYRLHHIPRAYISVLVTSEENARFYIKIRKSKSMLMYRVRHMWLAYISVLVNSEGNARFYIKMRKSESRVMYRVRHIWRAYIPVLVNSEGNSRFYIKMRKSESRVVYPVRHIWRAYISVLVNSEGNARFHIKMRKKRIEGGVPCSSYLTSVYLSIGEFWRKCKISHQNAKKANRGWCTVFVISDERISQYWWILKEMQDFTSKCEKAARGWCTVFVTSDERISQYWWILKEIQDFTSKCEKANRGWYTVFVISDERISPVLVNSEGNARFYIKMRKKWIEADIPGSSYLTSVYLSIGEFWKKCKILHQNAKKWIEGDVPCSSYMTTVYLQYWWILKEIQDFTSKCEKANRGWYTVFVISDERISPVLVNSEGNARFYIKMRKKWIEADIPGSSYLTSVYLSIGEFWKKCKILHQNAKKWIEGDVPCSSYMTTVYLQYWWILKEIQDFTSKCEKANRGWCTLFVISDERISPVLVNSERNARFYIKMRKSGSRLMYRVRHIWRPYISVLVNSEGNSRFYIKMRKIESRVVYRVRHIWRAYISVLVNSEGNARFYIKMRKSGSRLMYRVRHIWRAYISVLVNSERNARFYIKMRKSGSRLMYRVRHIWRPYISVLVNSEGNSRFYIKMRKSESRLIYRVRHIWRAYISSIGEFWRKCKILHQNAKKVNRGWYTVFVISDERISQYWWILKEMQDFTSKCEKSESRLIYRVRHIWRAYISSIGEFWKKCKILHQNAKKVNRGWCTVFVISDDRISPVLVNSEGNSRFYIKMRKSESRVVYPVRHIWRAYISVLVNSERNARFYIKMRKSGSRLMYRVRHIWRPYISSIGEFWRKFKILHQNAKKRIEADIPCSSYLTSVYLQYWWILKEMQDFTSKCEKSESRLIYRVRHIWRAYISVLVNSERNARFYIKMRKSESRVMYRVRHIWRPYISSIGEFWRKFKILHQNAKKRIVGGVPCSSYLTSVYLSIGEFWRKFKILHQNAKKANRGWCTVFVTSD